MIHVERLITSSLPRHVCIPRHISPILPRTSSPTSKGPYRKSLSFSMSSFGPWLSELFIRFNTPKSPNTPSKTGRLLNGALQKVHCSSNQSQFFFAAVKKFIEACRNNFAILGTCLKKKAIVLHPSVTNPSSRIPFLGQSQRTILTYAGEGLRDSTT
jgi:hypothetical protein